MKHSAALLATVVALSCVPSVSGQPTMSAAIDQVFASINPEGPGCNVGVIRSGQWIHKRGYGLANLELDIPLDGKQVHRMGSVSKQFTALAVLLLAEEGRIDLGADIHSYLPQLAEYGAPVTVEAMLGHLAGMGDYDLVVGEANGAGEVTGSALRSAAGGPFRLGNEDYLTIGEFYEVVKTLPLVQPPGEGFRYSNLAYFLLSMLVEEVSGESLRAYAERRIFEPLAMDDSFFSDDPVEVVKNRASGYRREDSGRYVTDMTNLFWVGDGGLHTTLDDMLKWDRHFYQPRVGEDPPDLLSRFTTPMTETGGEGAHYANGQFVGEIADEPAHWHSGGWLGTSTYYARFPERQTSLVMMCNDVSLDTAALADQLTTVVLSDNED